MEARELRIGSFVFNSNNELTEISLSRWKDIHDYSNLKPIPLTEEWLVKLGFRKESFPFDEYSDKPCYHKMAVKLRIINTFNKTNGFFFKHNSIMTDLKYVHQLQNLYFALTGEELSLIKETK